MRINDSVTRRKLLQSASHAMLLHPLMRVFQMDEAIGQEGILPRAIFVHWPCGTWNNAWFPEGGSGSLPSLAGRKVAAPLEAIKEDLIMFKGMCLRGASNHDGGPFQVLAGWGIGGAHTFNVQAPDKVPYSLDCRLADRWQSMPGKTAIDAVRLGAATSIPTLKTKISFDSKGEGVDFIDNPKLAFDNLFGAYTTAGLSLGSSSLALAGDNVLKGRKRMIDYLRGDIKKMKAVLGPLEGNKFEAHVSALDNIAKDIIRQEELNNPVDPLKPSTPTDGRPPKSMMCNPNPIKNSLPTASGGWHTQPNMMPTVYDLNNKIMVQAMACGLTRVGVISFGQSDTTFAYNGIDAYHGASHSNDEKIHNTQAKFMQSVVELVTELKKVTVGSRSLWDEVLLMGSTDIGDDPNGHDNVNVACFLAGRLGGRVKGNRLISYPFTPRDYGNTTNGISYNQLLQSFARLVGEDIDKIGSAAYGGVIKELF